MNLQALKQSTLSDSMKIALPVTIDNEIVARLVPVGSWILSMPEVICEMSEWRGRAMRMFLTQFESTPDLTHKYLATFTIGHQDRVLFMIESCGDFIGHIGLANVTSESAEVDNLVRGRSGGPPNLMEEIERTLVTWAFEELSLDHLYLRILSYNLFARLLHESIGFRVTERRNLRKVNSGDEVVLESCLKEFASVSYTCDIMVLLKSRFYLEQ